MNYEQRKWDRGYRHYCMADRTLPAYMERNLTDMPNNKGYLWKDVTFYGKKPDEKNGQTIIFEKGIDKLIIHQYSYINGVKNYKRSEKHYTDKKHDKDSDKHKKYYKKNKRLDKKFDKKPEKQPSLLRQKK